MFSLVDTSGMIVWKQTDKSEAVRKVTLADLHEHGFDVLSGKVVLKRKYEHSTVRKVTLADLRRCGMDVM
jgi:uncharacterized protein (UPF0128 family)